MASSDESQEFFEHDGFISRGGDSARAVMSVGVGEDSYKSYRNRKGFCHHVSKIRFEESESESKSESKSESESESESSHRYKADRMNRWIESRIRDVKFPSEYEGGDRVLVIGFNSHPRDFTDAICDSELAQRLHNRGIPISPVWANGAKILVEGLKPEIMKEAGFPPEDLRLWHVVVHPEKERDVFESLMKLTYRKRPREKSRKVISCMKQPSLRQLFVGRAFGGLGCCDEHESENIDADCMQEASQWSLEPLTRTFRGLCVTRTFIDVSKRERVGWSPRTNYTKSTSDRHGIENPRLWK